MKKMKLTSFLIIGICSSMLVGCNKEKEVVTEEITIETEEKNMFGLTESEQRMYAEYAAGALMKYNAGSNMRVLEGKTLVEQETKEQLAKEQAEKRAQLAAEYEANKNSNKKEEQNSQGNSSGNTEENSISYVSDMSQVTGTDTFSIVYDGYEITDSYPNSGDDILLAMDATSGKLLMVTKYKVTNISGQTEKLDMFSKQGKFRLALNGKRYKSQYTLLLNDLSMYKGEIEAGETIEGILIFEIPEEEAANVNDMILSITVDGESGSMQLQGGSTVMWTETVEDTEGGEENITTESTESEQEVSEEKRQDIEYNDLAEEYMNALEAENAGVSYNENSSVSDSENVTVVGSQRN